MGRMKTINVKRTGRTLNPDRSRVLIRAFRLTSEQRVVNICARVMALPEEQVRALLDEVMAEFAGRHQQTKDLFLLRYERVEQSLLTNQKLSEERKLLLGAYFTNEYALEAAALFNPSAVPHPDQSELISINTPTKFLMEPRQVPNAFYEMTLFQRKLYELGLASPFSRRLLGELGDTFTMEDLRKKLDADLKQARVMDPESERIAKGILLLAQSNYEVQFAPESRVSERVIFPTSPSQSNGIEDARFVLFQNEDGSRNYYATYTAYDGKLILPQLLETPDFLHFKFITLNGPGVQNKGMALFPRKIGGQYAILGRQDNENIYLMLSDNIHFWYDPKQILKPTFPWEFVQLGNCGSPLETDAGWLVLSHGVGAMRKYCIGAFLLDRDDPSKVIGRLPEPLLKPIEAEREGYVPNVVYSCGSLIHNRELILPYAMSDYATNFATVSLDEILAAME